jgi:CRISPR-associated protein Csb3
MSNPEPTIRVGVDLTNPGQFFACCGLLELADRLWPGVEGWFEGYPITSKFCIWVPNGNGSLRAILEAACNCEFDVGDDDSEEVEDDEEKAGPIDPIVIRSPVEMTLDWWSDKSIKPWAGSMNERIILRAMLRSISMDAPDPFNVEQAVSDPSTDTLMAPKGRQKKPKKREPFYFDCRRGSKSHPLDSGWSPDTHKMEHKCAPAVEALCFFGLQRCRPMPTGRPNTSRYTVWLEHLPVNVIASVVSGIVPVLQSVTYEFTNYFRTDQRKHKAFGDATCLIGHDYATH